MDAIDDAIAEIKRLRALTAWRPIADAPKDGENILVTDGNGIFVACWDYEANTNNAKENWCVYHSWDNATEAYMRVVANPTHWQPLPEPPGAQE